MKYKPLFNQVLVEIDDKEAAWGKGNNENIGGEAYREGTALGFGEPLETSDYPTCITQLIGPEGNTLESLIGKRVMWNEGHEAGKVFEDDGKLFALVYWWDLVAYEDISQSE